MPSLSDLDLLPEEDVTVTDLDQLQEGRAQRPDPPQPGAQRFRIPDNVSKAYELLDTQNGQKLEVRFEDTKALILSASNLPFWVRINNETREFKGKPSNAFASLLKALREKGNVGSIASYTKALDRHAGDEFVADVTYSASCNPSRDIFIPGKQEDGGGVQQGVKGCGAKYRQEAFTTKKGIAYGAIPRHEDGSFSTRFTCPCGASVSVFAGLENFRSI